MVTTERDVIAAGDRAPLLVADHPALDFLNSTALPEGVPVEWLVDASSVARWFVAAGLADQPVELGRDEGFAERLRGVREWLREVVERHAGRALAQGSSTEWTSLNALLATDCAFRQIAWRDGRYAWSAPQRRTGEATVIQGIATAIGDLLCDEDFTRVRHCDGEGCTLWFLDRTKGGRRRWCSMALCGNRAKARAHRARQSLTG